MHLDSTTSHQAPNPKPETKPNLQCLKARNLVPTDGFGSLLPTAAKVIEEMDDLPPEEQAKVIQHACELARHRQRLAE
jgi:hypothetical protein